MMTPVASILLVDMLKISPALPYIDYLHNKSRSVHGSFVTQRYPIDFYSFCNSDIGYCGLFAATDNGN